MSEPLSSVENLLEWVSARNPNEPEFQQAVAEVAENVFDLAVEEPYRRARVLQRLTEPDRLVSFRVVWEDDGGDFHVNRGYRVQMSNAIGPYKGGVRFHPSVTRSVLKFLAFEQTFKNSLTGLNLGGGKGGADFEPKGRSDREIMRFCHSFMTELQRHIGADTDVPAGDIGVGSREIGYLFGQYKRLQNRFEGAITGKALQFGGSALRIEATGYGCIYFVCHVLDRRDESMDGKKIAISGAGNVATHVAEKALAVGAIPLSLSNSRGALLKPDGFSESDVERLIALADDPETDLADVASDLDADWRAGEKPWQIPCDIAIPSATQNELDADDAKTLIDNGVMLVAEGANMPLTAAAREVFAEACVEVAPGKAANAGGVAVSGFEMSQNRLGQSWSRDRIDEELRAVMRRIHDQCVEQSGDGEFVDYSRGADRAGFLRVARALVAYGAT